MKSNDRSELRNHMLAGSFWKKACVVQGQRAVPMSGVSSSYPAGFQGRGNVSASQMAKPGWQGVGVTCSGNPSRE